MGPPRKFVSDAFVSRLRDEERPGSGLRMGVVREPDCCCVRHSDLWILCFLSRNAPETRGSPRCSIPNIPFRKRRKPGTCSGLSPFQKDHRREERCAAVSSGQGFDTVERLGKRRDGGLGEGKRKPFFRKVSPPFPQSSCSVTFPQTSASTCRRLPRARRPRRCRPW